MKILRRAPPGSPQGLRAHGLEFQGAALGGPGEPWDQPIVPCTSYKRPALFQCSWTGHGQIPLDSMTFIRPTGENAKRAHTEYCAMLCVPYAQKVRGQCYQHARQQFKIHTRTRWSHDVYLHLPKGFAIAMRKNLFFLVLFKSCFKAGFFKTHFLVKNQVFEILI